MATSVLYPIGIQNFPNLINRGFTYVDKTAYIYELVHKFQACFLSRPRRFGKSLLLSTMEAYFKGEKALFKGLAIESLEKEWISYPVIHIDLNSGEYESTESLRTSIEERLQDLEDEYGITRPKQTLGGRFGDIIKKASKLGGHQAVILIDEYDKPMFDILTDEEAKEEYRKVLKPFYGALKSNEAYIRFIFITGVTKLTKLSVFSDLNQLKDISLLPEYDTLCGITTQEMLKYFHQGVENLACQMEWTFNHTVEELEKKYDGYHFSRELRGVLNPFSVLNAFNDGILEDYWFQSGTPSLIANQLLDLNFDLAGLDGYQAEASLLTSVESIKINPVPVIYQSGYLTIKGYDKTNSLYILGYPNEEVKQGFLAYLLPRYAQLRGNNSKSEIDHLVIDFRKGDPQAVLLRLQSFLAETNYDLILDCEAHYQNVLYIVFSLIGLRVEVEKRISNGRIDMVVKTDKYIYVMEFKYNGTAQQAIDQIIEKEYALPYRRDPRQVYLIGVNFSAEIRNIEPNWIIIEE